MVIKKIHHNSLNNIVYEELKQRIIDNELKPGDKLDVEQLAEMLGVSRTPVSNALKQLELNGYVTVYPRKGSYVRELSKEEIQAIFEFREVLEMLVAEKAIKKAEAKRLKRFAASFRSMAKTFTGGDDEIEEFFQVEIDFHEYLIGLSPQIIGSELKNLIDLTKRTRRLHLLYSQQGSDKQVMGESEILLHLDLCEAIMNEDLLEVQRLIREDIGSTKCRIFEHYDEIEAFGKHMPL